ncbi:hypothetical protein [Sphingomonas sp. CCH5-D11]|uniref:hypothetical protein n=1 Tax=Sphingomonas sp. CCH5-D11 TaxID=1768786 RepID=UPI00082E3052|nr:hypothetical protein [Sphingomonas sp. CCH5-D11]
MNEVVSKFSSYNIFNYLVPGTVLCLFLHGQQLIYLDRIDIVAKLVVFYVVGMAVSRVGSLILDPLMKRAGLIQRSSYNDYVRATSEDNMVSVLLETSNTYRTMTGACGIGLIAYLLSAVLPEAWLRHGAAGAILIAAATALFAFAYIKQNRSITRRVSANKAIRPANDPATSPRELAG